MGLQLIDHIPEPNVTPEQEQYVRGLLAFHPDLYAMVFQPVTYYGLGHQNGTRGRRRAIQRRTKGNGARPS